MECESRMVSLVDLVYLVSLVERDKPNEQNRSDEPVLQVSRGYHANKAFLIPIPDRYYCTAMIFRLPGVGGAARGGGGGGGGDEGGGGGRAVATTVNVTGTAIEEAPAAFMVIVAL
jgi:hypothetical protein